MKSSRPWKTMIVIKQIAWETRNGSILSPHHSALVKTCKILCWSITQEPIGLLNLSSYGIFEFLWQICFKLVILFLKANVDHFVIAHNAWFWLWVALLHNNLPPTTYIHWKTYLHDERHSKWQSSEIQLY